MLLLIQIMAGALAVSVLIQTLLCAGYGRAMRRGLTAYEARKLVGDRPPRICVVMPLRGADPFLRNAIRSVVDNEYPNLQLCVVLDSEHDPAHDVVRQTLGDVPTDRFQVDVLRDHSAERSLVCSSLLQAVDDHQGDCDLFSFCAADMIVPADWYWQVSAAMSDETVGCTLGNRWYQPRDGQTGSLVRQAWNAGAAVLMWLFQIPWGGAATLRPDDIRRSGLYAAWQSSMVEDVTIFAAMRRLGKSLRFVPALTVTNYEEISLTNAFRFIQRQMLWARLYHPRWWLVLLHAISGCAATALPLVIAVIAASNSQTTLAGWASLVLVGYILALVGLWLGLERIVASVRNAELSEPLPATTWGRLLRMVAVMPLVQFVYPVAAIGCCFSRDVVWRGIRYEFLGSGRVRMTNYSPFSITAQPTDGKSSI